VIGTVLVLGALAVGTLAFTIGRVAGRNAFLYALERNSALRKQILERLAQLDGAKLVWRQ
jgi:membrane protein DedA with SNARE-associated domain